MNPKLLVDDFLVLKQIVKGGLGLAILPDYMCTNEINSGQLVSVLPNWGMPNVEAYALYPKHRLKIPKVAAFVEYTQETFSERLSQSKTGTERESKYDHSDFSKNT